MNVKQVLFETTKKLKQKIKNIPHLEAEILLSYILKKPREYLFTHPEKQLTKKQIFKVRYLISKRVKGIPVAYLIGRKQFYCLDFYVNIHVLIPRPETELIVDEVISLLRSILTNKQKITIIDIGTGSGCVIISIIKSLQKNKCPISNIKFIASDISKPALEVAYKNARKHKVNKYITFLNGNLLYPIINNSKFKIQNSKFIITANLPYLTPKQIKISPTIKFEPKIALLAGSDGLKYYRRIFKQLKLLNCALCLMCEINAEQTLKFKKIINEYLPKAKIQIKKDLKGHNRLILIKI